ncbi:guanylate kinase [Protaetiibacter mangrovi]|uniref:Guanylate kinase n=1 Tax=Protaetiibacter mangrovi TaxID=2970926 RepID=A0ABT1ZBW8_9MICO|nr:guanylate kinase [Protaetiibacter mangrovi]MCS0498202.1 guanylate kinase [Protaetiibacter mangrovi]TPX05134.1 guanylate kinase [Schumannella luteola]
MTMPEVDRAAAGRAAIAARRARAAVKDAVHRRERRALDVAETAWADPTTPEGTLRVRELLTSIPGIGPTRVARVMAELAIADSKRVGGLGARQRDKLREWLELREGPQPRPQSRLVVLAGPTAVGKGTVSTYIRDHHPEVLLSVSATTRPPRPGEVDGQHYYFIDDEAFDRMVEHGEFLEHATVHNASRYGTPRPPIDAALASGRSVLLEIDLQGARAVKEAMPEALLVFLLPPSWEELVRRLTGRGTESAAEQARRLDTARVELAAQDEFDVKVVNRDVGRAAREVVELLAVPGTPSARTRS